MGKLTGIPCFSSGNADLDRAFRLALDTLQSKKIIVCEYCGRILVSSAFAKEN